MAMNGYEWVWMSGNRASDGIGLNTVVLRYLKNSSQNKSQKLFLLARKSLFAAKWMSSGHT
ncbi:hypothetical protein [Xenorhabdus lircayensis]|uniref:hypothetical protein n=1 Tax=Xenorhabdus lircayensis TaxID=2763499 RepID=UPI0038CD4727